MLIYFFKFETKPAVAISSFSILVCTTMRFLYNFRARHPERPYVNVLDYGLASIMMPTTLAGSEIGGYILLIFPAIYIQGALTLLLAFLTYQTTKKGLQIHRKEVFDMKNKRSLVGGIGEHDDNRNNPGLQSRNDSSFYESKEYGDGNINRDDNQSIEGDIEPLCVQDGKILHEIVIGGKKFKLGENDKEQDAELIELQKIAKREEGHQ